MAKFWAGKTKNGHVDFANWPLYMDPKKPELAQFTKETGITVNYQEVIEDDASWFAKVQPQLAAQQSIGYDLMVITNGVQFKQFVQLGLPRPAGPHQAAELRRQRGAELQERGLRPGQRLQHPVGVRHHRHRVRPGKITDGRSPSWPTCGTRRTRARSACSPTPQEIGNFGMLAVGIDPEKSTEDDWQKAADKLKQQKDAGIVRKYYDQDYIDALGSGDIWITQAWSGDIFQKNVSDGTNLQFVIPEEGGTIWTDNMTIPITADEPGRRDHADGLLLQAGDRGQPGRVHQLHHAGPGRPGRSSRQDAAAATGDDKTTLEAVANSPLVFPDESDYAKLHYYRDFATRRQQHQTVPTRSSTDRRPDVVTSGAVGLPERSSQGRGTGQARAVPADPAGRSLAARSSSSSRWSTMLSLSLQQGDVVNGFPHDLALADLRRRDQQLPDQI